MQRHGLTTFFISLSPLSCFFRDLVNVAIEQFVHVQEPLFEDFKELLRDGLPADDVAVAVNCKNHVFKRDAVQQVIAGR